MPRLALRCASALCFLAVAAAAPSAHAAPRHHEGEAYFHDAGNFVISATSGGSILAHAGLFNSIAGVTGGFSAMTPLISWSHDSVDSDNNNASQSQSLFVLSPGADYFVIDGFSVGGEFLVAHGSSSTTDGSGRTFEQSADAVGIAPRAGFDFAFSEAVSFWIRGGIGYLHGSAGDKTTSLWSVGVDAQFLWHVHPNFFIGAGPGVSRDLSSSITTDLGNGSSRTDDRAKITHWRWIGFTIGGVF